MILESGTGDVSAIWALVQTEVAKVNRVCSYDRGGYAWSEPGNHPRTFAQLSLELRTALEKLHIDPPYVLVGQSYGDLLIPGFQARYAKKVAGMILVDAVHENQHIVYGGQLHRIRQEARGREAPPPSIARNAGAPASRRAVAQDGAQKPLDPSLDRLARIRTDDHPICR